MPGRMSEGAMAAMLDMPEVAAAQGVDVKKILEQKREKWLARIEQTKRAFTLVFLHNQQGTYCFLHRSDLGKGEHLDKMYSVWGGKVEPGETVKDAALREVREEVGLSPNDAQLIGAIFIQSVNSWLFYYDCPVDTDFSDINWTGREGEALVGRWVDTMVHMSTQGDTMNSEMPPNFPSVLKMVEFLKGDCFLGTMEDDRSDVLFEVLGTNFPDEIVPKLADEVAKFITTKATK